jgi:hypothetical protein
MSAGPETDARGSAETIVEFLVDGGSVVLTRRRAPDGTWTFEVIADQASRFALFGDDELEDLGGFLSEQNPVATWEEALGLLDCYTWAMSPPKWVHPEFRQAVWAALLDRSRDAEPYLADLIADRLPEWEELCREE